MFCSKTSREMADASVRLIMLFLHRNNLYLFRCYTNTFTFLSGEAAFRILETLPYIDRWEIRPR